MTELATGRYHTFEPSMGVAVRITAGAPKFPLRYEINHQIRRLTPWGLLNLQGDKFVRAYRERLDRLDIDALVQRFEAIGEQEGGRRLVLLCFEDVWAGQACHRRVFAEWFQERTGQQVPEIGPPGPRQPQLTPEARADLQVALDREAQRMLEAGWRNDAEGQPIPPKEGS